MNSNHKIILLESKKRFKDEEDESEDKLEKKAAKIKSNYNVKVKPPLPSFPQLQNHSTQTKLSTDTVNNNCFPNNLINLNRINKMEESNKDYYEDGDNETRLGHLDDLYLRDFLVKILTYLGMDNLKLIKETRLISDSDSTKQLSHSRLEFNVRASNEVSTNNCTLSNNESVASNKTLINQQQHQEIKLYDETWSIFDKLRHLYRFEVSCFIFLNIFNFTKKK
jgi:hypothetical protein